MNWRTFTDEHPRDGQHILFLAGGSVWLGNFYEGNAEHVASLITAENNNEIFLDDDLLPATHWMPIPTLPEGIELYEVEIEEGPPKVYRTVKTPQVL